jgi:hypothetical protein
VSLVETRRCRGPQEASNTSLDGLRPEKTKGATVRPPLELSKYFTLKTLQSNALQLYRRTTIKL